MGLFEWGEKRFARGIARAMIHSYKLTKSKKPNLNERELIKFVLSARPGQPAAEILKDVDTVFWENIARENFGEVVYILTRVEYIESMHGTIEVESEKTNAVFKQVISDEIQKASLPGFK